MLLFFLFVQFFFLVVGLNTNEKNEWMNKHGIKTEAVVVDSYSGYRYRTIYVINYKDNNGNEITNELENTYLKIGEKIEIIYSPNDPRIFIYPNNNSGNMLYLISAMFGLFGLLGLGIKLS